MATETSAILSIVPSVAPVTGSVPQDRKPAQEAERVADLRLVIEQGNRPGSFVYKTVDRVTGEVVRQLPREDVVKLAADGDYRSGRVADTKA